MVTLEVPPALADAAEHADWLELKAVVSPGSISSSQDLIGAVRRAGSIDAKATSDDEPLDDPVEREDEELERLADAAFEELVMRQRYLGGCYPFSVNSALRAEADAQASPYVFLTALTCFGPTLGTAPESGASLFERVSAAALVEYLGGTATARSYHFGFPRRVGPKAFHDAIADLCRQLGEGRGCKVSRPKTAHVKDAKLDLVAWLPFQDMRRNQLSVFGQCAAGTGWQAKLNELQPYDFCHTWMEEPPAMSRSLPSLYLGRSWTTTGSRFARERGVSFSTA